MDSSLDDSRGQGFRDTGSDPHADYARISQVWNYPALLVDRPSLDGDRLEPMLPHAGGGLPVISTLYPRLAHFVIPLDIGRVHSGLPLTRCFSSVIEDMEAICTDITTEGQKHCR